MSADTGSADPRLAAALASGDRSQVLAALVDARVFAAVTATATSEHTTAAGLRADSSAEMAVVLLETEDGSRALPVFADLEALQAWRPGARPVSLTGRLACAAALDDGADALLLDPDGTAVVVTELRTLAAGWVPVPGSALASRRAPTALVEPATAAPPALVDALRTALQGEGLRAARLLEGPDGPVLGVAPRRPLPPQELAALAHRLVERLGEALPTSGLDLAEVPVRGPGQDVLRRGWLRPAR